MIPLTHQEMFDKVATHLLTQRRKSWFSAPCRVCAYRSSDGTRCAIGSLIPDKSYSLAMENLSVENLVNDGALESSGIDKSNLYLASTLQLVHDATEPEFWPSKLSFVAGKYGLSDAVVRNHKGSK